MTPAASSLLLSATPSLDMEITHLTHKMRQKHYHINIVASTAQPTPAGEELEVLAG